MLGLRQGVGKKASHKGKLHVTDFMSATKYGAAFVKGISLTSFQVGSFRYITFLQPLRSFNSPHVSLIRG